MEKNYPLPMTPFDELSTSPQFQTMKLLLPYLPASYQKLLAFYIKFMEFQKIRYYFSIKRNPPYVRSVSSPDEMLNELRPYLTPEDCESLDSVLSILNMMELMKTMNMDSSSDASNANDFFDFSNLMNLFSFSENTGTPQKGSDIND